ncbi:MAG: sensor histidine kinase, partial [Bacteroidota bacterium]
FEGGSTYIINHFLPFMIEAGWSSESQLFKISITFTLCLMVLAMYESAYFFKKYRHEQVKREQLAKENMQTQLAVLKQQMNPHFLFNSLNTLINVIPEDSEKAMLFTQRLAAVYRRILEYRHKELIPLEEELIALKDYVFLMQTRFEDKLVVKWGMSDRTMNAFLASTQVPSNEEQQCKPYKKEPTVPSHLAHHMVVPLSVQLLVENAIKHNVVSFDTPLLIEIVLDDAEITVRNRLNLRARKLTSTGWGHQNLEQRYQSLTGQSIVIRQSETEYSVSLPVVPPRVAARAAVG